MFLFFRKITTLANLLFYFLGKFNELFFGRIRDLNRIEALWVTRVFFACFGGKLWRGGWQGRM